MQSISHREDLLSKAEAMKVLPTLNAVIDEVLRVLADENSSFNRLFNVVEIRPGHFFEGHQYCEFRLFRQGVSDNQSGEGDGGHRL